MQINTMTDKEWREATATLLETLHLIAEFPMPDNEHDLREGVVLIKLLAISAVESTQ